MGENEKLTCQKLVKRDGGRDPQNKPLTYHEKCGQPASEIEVAGMLTTAKAVLCAKHRAQAEHESFVSKNGYRKGQIDERATGNGYQQLPFNTKR